jgi:hypothetical protein
MRNELKLAKIAKLELNGYRIDTASNKKVYLSLGRSVLRSLAKALGLKEFKVSINKAGPAVSGDITLIGMWDDNDGIYVSMSSPMMCKENGQGTFFWRSCSAMNDYTGGHNRNMTYEELAEGVEAAATQMRWALGR